MRGLRVASGVVLLLCVAAGSVFAQADENVQAAPTRHLAGPVHEIMLADGRINMVASVGEDGILLVDTGYEATAASASLALEGLGGGPVRVIVNTHGDQDHVGGNSALGPEALTIAHPEARRQAGAYHALPAVSTEGLPRLLVTEETTLHFNGETIRVVPIPGGHTSGDLVVHFTGSGVAVVGDIVLTGTFPDADPGRGGDAQCLARILRGLVRELPAETVLVPGHGDTLGIAELNAYIAMIEGTTAAIRTEMAAGKIFDGDLAAEVLAPWEQWQRAGDGLAYADWGGQIWASLTGIPRLSVCAPMTETLVDDGIDAAVATYHRLAAEEAGSWNFGENQLNSLGYHLLQRDMVEEAIAIFELNVEAFPEASNPYDSLGEAYMTAGDTAPAIANYRRSLELDPGNANAVAMLQRLGAME